MESDRAAIYCRLSVEDIDKLEKGDDSESIQNQKLLLMDYALSQGWSIHKVYSDDDYSGLDRNRPAFNKMVGDAQDGKFNIILCKAQSRFTRDMELVEKYIHGLFPEWGVRFISVVDNVDTAVKGNKKARQIYGLINEWYCEDLSENIRAVFRRKMQDGQFIGSFAPFGYKKDPRDRHKLVVDAEAADIVRHIFDLYLRGLGCRQIASRLITMEVPTPTVYKQMKGLKFANPNAGKYSAVNGVWASNTVNRILKNRVYIGTLIQGRERKVSYKSSKVTIAPMEEWVVIENNHEPIVDKDIFFAVQNLISGRRIAHRPRSGHKGNAVAHPLSGKIRCADCGANMTRGALARNGEHYLRCSLAYNTRNSVRQCTPHSIRLEQIEKLTEERVKRLIDEYLFDENEAALLKDYCFKQDDLKRGISDKEKELNTIKNRYAELSMTVVGAYIDKSKGVLSESDFIGIKDRLNEEMAQLGKRQLQIENSIKETRHRMNIMSSTDDLLKSFVSFKSLDHTMVNDFIDYIEVGEKEQSGEQKVIIHWRF